MAKTPLSASPATVAATLPTPALPPSQQSVLARLLADIDVPDVEDCGCLQDFVPACVATGNHCEDRRVRGFCDCPRCLHPVCPHTKAAGAALCSHPMFADLAEDERWDAIIALWGSMLVQMYPHEYRELPPPVPTDQSRQTKGKEQRISLLESRMGTTSLWSVNGSDGANCKRVGVSMIGLKNGVKHEYALNVYDAATSDDENDDIGDGEDAERTIAELAYFERWQLGKVQAIERGEGSKWPSFSEWLKAGERVDRNDYRNILRGQIA